MRCVRYQTGLHRHRAGWGASFKTFFPQSRWGEPSCRFRSLRSSFLCGVLFSVLISATALAEVGDPTLRTDHPQYAGEGAFQTIEDCATFAAQGATTPQDRALAMYQWLLTHQWHLVSPQEPNMPGEVPDTRRSDDYEQMVYDANRARFSYGYGLCGTVHSWNEPYWKALGMNARRRAFPGHTNSEIEYDGSWHAFDTDMAGLVFRHDGVVAGYEDIVKDPSLILNAKPPIPCYPFAWPNDFQTMEQGWREVAKGANWYKMYNSGYAAHPAIVHLRSGETFTRYFDRDHFGGPSQRLFWHHEPGGPTRDWTFANRGVPEHRGPQSNCRSLATYCNGEFVYQPELWTDQFREGIVQATSNVVGVPKGKARLQASDGGEASCTFSHFSPYVICGDPEDDANPMTAHATEGFVVEGLAIGQVRCQVSADQGQTWHDVGELRGLFQKDLTDFVKGHYGWYVRFAWSGTSGLDRIRFVTVTQVCQTIYPRLKPDGSRVVYQCASRAVTPVLPNFGLSEAALELGEVKDLRSANVRYVPRTRNSRYVYQTTNNKPGHVVFKIEAPRELVEISAAARFGIRVPPPEGSDFRMELSTDGGKSWQPLARAEIPADNEYSSGWMSGRLPIRGESKSALLRVHLYAGGHATGLIELQAYGIYRTEPPQPVTITYSWKENGSTKSHREQLPANTTRHEFVVPTGPQIVDDFVRFELP